MRCALALWLVAATGCSFPDYGLVPPEPVVPDKGVMQPEPVVVATCQDGLQNAGEVDVDCGPACHASCAIGKPCSADGECVSGFCDQGVCALPSCTDNTRNRTE